MKTPKPAARPAGQPNIASFFTKRPNPAAPAVAKGEAAGEPAATSPNENAGPAVDATAAASAKPAAASPKRTAASSKPAAPKRKPDKAAAAPSAEADGSTKPLKRLRKASPDSKAAPAQAAAAAAADELEDADAAGAGGGEDAGQSPSPALGSPNAGAAASPSSSSGKGKGSGKAKAKAKPAEGVEAAAVNTAVADELAAEEEEVAEEIAMSSGSETGDEQARPSTSSPKRKKVAAKKKASPRGKGKVEGVGAGAVSAAAEHANFDVSKLVSWKEGEPVPFAFLTAAFELIGEEPKRLIMTRHLINTFRAVIATTPADLLPMVYLCTNRVAPAHDAVELGIGDATLIKALAQATGRKEEVIKAEYDEIGDLGLVAAKARASQKQLFPAAALTVQTVFKTFQEICAMSGTKSGDRKRGAIVKLLARAKREEAGYVMRALQGKLRIGLAEQTVLTALAHAAALEKAGGAGSSSVEQLAGELEQAAQIVKQVYSECPSYDELVPALLQHSIDQLPSHVHFKPGVPVKPMLAKPTTGVSEVLDKFTDAEFTCEYKYDGERAQIHVVAAAQGPPQVKIYSRNSEDNTGKYPDIAALIPKRLKDGVTSVVLDAEAVAWCRETSKVLPFQVLSTRSRKDVTLDNIKVQVCVFAFDCLSINGRTLLQEPLTARREALYSALDPEPGKLELATAKTSRDVEELTRFLDESVEAGTEGLIVKTMDDFYEPSKRSSHWLKLKKDYLEGVGDTFDLVPIGAWYGKGKRAGVFGSYLLAAYDQDGEEYQTISKIGTGFSEEQLKQLAEQMGDLVIPEPRKYYRYGETLVPDVWFDAKSVWEVKAADLSISPLHKAAIGLVDGAKGISIRFPRLVRVRDDKGPEDATSAEQVAEMYRRQAVLQQKQKGAAVAEDDE
ncbi:DNA ligase 1 [Chlorella vulgaris]